MISVNRQTTLAGVIGLLAAILVGSGEFLLHFDLLGRFGETGGYEYMQGISSQRSNIGHFLGVFAAPLYVVGFWHLKKMLEPANPLAAKIGFMLLSYGIIIGAVWIGSRASISALVNEPGIANPRALISLYELRYENLLQITRISLLVYSLIFTWLVLTGRSRYPRWMFIFNPILLLLLSFVIWAVAPAIGIYLMPIALNVAFILLFVFSTYFSLKTEVQ